MQMYMALMTAYGRGEGIEYKFGGTVANTLHAHRVIQHFQATKGPEVADQLIDSLYRQYFEEEQHPSSTETLVAAAMEAGIDEKEARAFVEDEDEGLADVKMAAEDGWREAGMGSNVQPLVFRRTGRRISINRW